VLSYLINWLKKITDQLVCSVQNESKDTESLFPIPFGGESQGEGEINEIDNTIY